MTQVQLDVWTVVCAVDDIPRGQGVAVMVECEQVAIFQTDDGEFFALGNRDPYTHANVLSRGILGTRGVRSVVVSPMLKHAFELATGVSCDNHEVAVPTFPLRLRDGLIEVGISA